MTKYARTYRQEDHEDSDVIHVLREVGSLPLGHTASRE